MEGSITLREYFRIISESTATAPDDTSWHEAIVSHNLLQKNWSTAPSGWHPTLRKKSFVDGAGFLDCITAKGV